LIVIIFFYDLTKCEFSKICHLTKHNFGKKLIQQIVIWSIFIASLASPIKWILHFLGQFWSQAPLRVKFRFMQEIYSPHYCDINDLEPINFIHLLLGDIIITYAQYLKFHFFSFYNILMFLARYSHFKQAAVNSFHSHRK